ncbi:MAG: FkbM family methyltransferase [Bacteroidetes bacterium]|nr:FkbM family methyltransferase [Bacteroidota bacterium]
MSNLRKILLSVLGERKYLSLLASSFQKLYKAGKLGIEYQDIYFLKSIVGEGNYCVDIGAHLGYYTMELSRLVKSEGKVLAVEPMTKFNRTLQNMLEKKGIRNVEIFQVALGGKGDFVEMGIPKVDKMKKFGYARVIESNTSLNYIESEKVKNESGDHLFENLPRLDFIKCDVEGLEVQVFSSMLKTIAKHQPILLCELAQKEERIKLFEMISPFSYNIFYLENKMLHRMDVNSDKHPVSHNHYFIPAKQQERLSAFIR